MTVQIGLVEEVQFHIYKGKTFSFDALWWLDSAKTQPAPITSVRGKIKQAEMQGSETVIDLTPTFVGNRAIVRLSPSQTLALVGESGYLELEASTDTDTKALVRGRVHIHPEVSE